MHDRMCRRMAGNSAIAIVIEVRKVRTPLRRWLLFATLSTSGISLCVADAVISGRVIDADGKGVAQAVVFVQSPLEPQTSVSAAEPPAKMDQVNKIFVPAVLPVVVGTKVYFPNRDNIRHHVYSFSRTKSFELPLYKGEDAPPVLFDKPGVVKIGCNIHDWMSATILVLPNTHFAMTTADGRFSLPRLKSGSYSLVAWHAQARDKTESTAQQVQLAETNVELTYQLTLVPLRARPAIHGVK
jgi:plastocyanin